MEKSVRYLSWLVLVAGSLIGSGVWAVDTEKPEPPPVDLSTLQSISWEKSFEVAREASSKAQKALMVDFGAEWCGFCKKLDRETFSNELVIRLVREHLIAVKVDADKEKDLAKKYNVTGLPTVLFLSPGGDELQRIVGFRPPDLFIKDARKAAESSASLTKLRENAEKNPKDIEAQRAYARAVFAAGNSEEAMKILRGALEASTSDARVQAGLLLDMGDALRLAGKAQEAKEMYQKLLGLSPEVAGEERQRALLPLARTLLSLKDCGGAIPLLDEHLKKESTPSPERMEALFLRSYAHAVQKDATRALADLKAAREADPDGRWGLRAGLILEALEQK